MQPIADGVPLRISKRKEEKLPLKYSDSGIYRPWYAPHGSAFNVIILCMVIFSVAVTVALIVQIAYTDQAIYYGGSIVTENYQCGTIGHNVLQEGGSAVDAAIAMQFCLGVTMPHLTGIGGGGFMVIYKNGITPENVSINFREAVPIHYKSRTLDPNKSHVESIGVPGSLRGLGLAHERYGKLPWERLLRPSIQLAVEGFFVGSSLFQIIHDVELYGPYLQNLFFPNGSSVYLNEKITRVNLGNTLNIIANEGPNALYNGSLTEDVLRDLQSLGGLISATDLSNYQAVQEPPVEIAIKNFNILASPFPSGGPSLVHAMQMLNSSVVMKSHDSFGWYTALLEALESEATNLGYLPLIQDVNATAGDQFRHNSNNDESLQRNAQFYMRREQTAYVVREGSAAVRTSPGATVIALDSDELFVTMVSGLGSPFGSQIVTSSGIIFNDALLGANPALESNDRPVSTLVAEVVMEHNRPCGVRLAASSADYQMLIQANLQFLTGLTPQDSFLHPRLSLTTAGKDKIITVDENNSSLNAQIMDNLITAGYTFVKTNQSSTPVSVIGKQDVSAWSFTDAKPEGFNDSF